MAEEDKEEPKSEEESQPENKLEEATGFSASELARAPLEPPEDKLSKPPRGGLGLAVALAAGIFIFALIIGAAASWLAAGILLIIGALAIAPVCKLANRYQR